MSLGSGGFFPGFAKLVIGPAFFSLVFVIIAVSSVSGYQVESKLPPGIVMVSGQYVCSKDQMPMEVVPEGEFIMGSNKGCYDEQPPHKVFLSLFLLTNTKSPTTSLSAS